jgi:hypothetical protein
VGSFRIEKENIAMGKPFHVTLCIEGQSDVIASGIVTDEEYGILELYFTQSIELTESKPIKEGMPCNISVDYDADDGLKVTSKLPNKDDLSILLHRLRPFILQKEPASFVKVSSILSKYISGARFRQFIRQQRELYDGSQAQRMFRVVSNSVIVNSERILYDWLNSHEYHRDPNKRASIDDLFKRMPNELLHGLLVSMLVDKTRAVCNVALIVAVVIGKSAQINFRV